MFVTGSNTGSRVEFSLAKPTERCWYKEARLTFSSWRSEKNPLGGGVGVKMGSISRIVKSKLCFKDE